MQMRVFGPKTSSDMRCLAAAIGIAIALLSPEPALAAEEPASIRGCEPAVGTFLLSRHVARPDGATVIERSLISLTNGGHAFFTDSAQGGVDGYQPFSEARGAWECTSADDGTLSILMLDFTFPTKGEPEQKIARIAMDAAFAPDGSTLSGTANIAFTALEDDPLDAANLTDPIEYDFEGVRIAIPQL